MLSKNLREVAATPSMEDDDHGYFKSHRGAKKPECVCFQKGVEQFAYPWRLSGKRTFRGDTITLQFPDETVTVKGKGLAELWDFILRERVFHIEQGDPSAIAVHHPPSYVEEITVNRENM